MGTLQSFIGGRWHGKEAHQPLHSALNNSLIYHTHAEAIDFGEVLEYGRKTGIPALMALGAAFLWAVAMILMRTISRNESSLVLVFSLLAAFAVERRREDRRNRKRGPGEERAIHLDPLGPQLRVLGGAAATLAGADRDHRPHPARPRRRPAARRVRSPLRAGPDRE